MRRLYRRHRRSLNADQQTEHAVKALQVLTTTHLLLRKGPIAVYLANELDGELNTLPLIERLWRMGKTVALPVIARNHPVMDFYRYTQATRLVENRYGIFEPGPDSTFINPRSLCLLFVPLVAFDSSGNRIGMGAGFYDRYLGNLQPAMRPKIVGFAHEVQRHAGTLPRNSWDIPLDAVVTESSWQTFTHQAGI